MSSSAAENLEHSDMFLNKDCLKWIQNKKVFQCCWEKIGDGGMRRGEMTLHIIINTKCDRNQDWEGVNIRHIMNKKDKTSLDLFEFMQYLSSSCGVMASLSPSPWQGLSRLIHGDTVISSTHLVVVGTVVVDCVVGVVGLAVVVVVLVVGLVVGASVTSNIIIV